MPTSTVILHGWSDCSDSFVEMRKFLSKAGVTPISEIYYADYESREDHITFDDVIDGLNDEFHRRGFITRDGRKKRDLNVVVHSTGGLVIRHWIHQHYQRNSDRLDDCPVKRLVMLAPANFGSPLAHRGKSFLGSLFKGRWKIGDLLEVGRHMLDGLELASPYQWELAHRDLLIGADRRPYHQNSGTPPHHAHDHGVPRPTPRGNAVARMELMRNPGRGAPASTVPHCAGAPCGLRDGADMHRYSDFGSYTHPWTTANSSVFPRNTS